MFTIIVVSDSHTNSLNNFPQKVLDEMSGTDMIIHAGDFTSNQVLDGLRKIGNFVGVRGNMDHTDVWKDLPDKQLIDVEGFKIGVAHPSDGGSPFGTEKKVRALLQEADVIIHGHTHISKNRTEGGLTYFNPGSVTGAFPATRKTYGRITIKDSITGEIIRV